MVTELEYVVLKEFEMETLDTHKYGYAPTSGRDDRIGMIIKVDLPDKTDKTVYILYSEGFYRYSCTENYSGENKIYIGDYFITVPSETIDYHYTIFSTYEEVLEYLRSIDLEYYYINYL